MIKETIICKYYELKNNIKGHNKSKTNRQINLKNNKQETNKEKAPSFTLLDRLPHVGEVFAIKAKYISNFIIMDADKEQRLVYQQDKNKGLSTDNKIRNDQFNKKIDYDSTLNIESVLEDKYLLVKYLGDGIIEEFYTSKHIRLVFSNPKDEIINLREFSSRGPMEFMETYQTIVENPLIYYIDHTIYDNTNCYVIDDALKLKLYENIAFEDSIIHALERTENKAKENLTRQFHRLIEEDYPYAFLENQIYDLEKRKTKKYQA